VIITSTPSWGKETYNERKYIRGCTTSILTTIIDHFHWLSNI
jgi:hypothetical protein